MRNPFPKGAVWFLAIILLFGFGLHKIDTNTTNDLAAQSHHNAVLAYRICTARNTALGKSNIRWHNEKLAWTAAAEARRASAALAPDAASQKIDLKAAKTYQRVADSIAPIPTTPCGDKP